MKRIFLFFVFVCKLAVAQEVTRAVKPFSKLDLSSAFDVSLLKGDEYQVELSGAEAELTKIVITEGEILEIRRESGTYINNNNNNVVKIKIFTPKPIEKIAIQGAVRFKGSFNNQKKIAFDLLGAARLDVKLNDVKELSVDSKGASKLNLSGSVDQFKIGARGASLVRAYDLRAKKVQVNLHGSGNAQVYASEFISAEILGVGKLSYKGNPKKTSFGYSHKTSSIMKVD